MKQPPIKLYPPAYAYGYISANELFKPTNKAFWQTAVNGFQAREQQIMRTASSMWDVPEGGKGL